MENKYKVFIHLEKEIKSTIDDEYDYKYLLDKELIIEKDSKFFTDFVGEVRTPHNSYFSLPKNFDRNECFECPFYRRLRMWKNFLNKRHRA